jgi:putative Holliday junction resolvase
VRALGIDLGTKRIGVALADSAGTMATPYEVVHRSGDRRADHRRIAELAAETDAVQLVVGLPLSLDGSEGKAARLALREVEELKRDTGLPVVTWDERLTTVTADRDLMLMDMKADARRRVVDKVAAAVMLQAWLDHRRLTANEEPSPHD